MTIRIYERTDFRGKSRVVDTDIQDLGRDVNRPSSIWLDHDDDAVLLYKRDGWRGGVIYLRGEHAVADLGSPLQGGKRTFGNSIASVRKNPFRLDLNITIVEKRNGDLPRKWKNELRAERDVQDIVRLANDFYRQENALIELHLARIRHRVSERLWALPDKPSIPKHWRSKGDVDVVIADHFSSGQIGQAPFPNRGSVIRMAAGTLGVGRYIEQSSVEMAGTLVHELGHYLGLRHVGDELNIMHKTSDRTILAQHLTSDQIHTLHDRLSQNPSRRRVRNT